MNKNKHKKWGMKSQHLSFDDIRLLKTNKNSHSNYVPILTVKELKTIIKL